jgi:5-(carboxyamino)imidazole ribonucleotide synthase
MVNFIGNVPQLEHILRLPGAHFHGYGKQPRPKRKLAHCTINAASGASRDRTLQQVLRLAARAARN